MALVEQGTMGGTCVNNGCVPSKTLIKAAELCYRAAYPTFEGLTACPPPSDWQRVVRQKDELVAALRQGKYVEVVKLYPTITLIRGRATLTGPRTVTVGGGRPMPPAASSSPPDHAPGRLPSPGWRRRATWTPLMR